MRLLLLSSEPLGHSVMAGTERVALSLARHFVEAGHEVHLAGHAREGDALPGETEFEGLRLHVLPPLPAADRAAYFGLRLPEAPGFQGLMERVAPDIVQIFGMAVPGINRRHLEIAKAFGARTVLWHNVPGITCLQRGLLFERREPCDGRIEVGRCTYCRLKAARVPTPVAWLASRMPLGAIGGFMPPKLDFLLGARRYTAAFEAACHAAFADLDAVQAGAQWVVDVLARNGVPASKLHLIRPGVPSVRRTPRHRSEPANIWRRRASGGLRLIYWGRIRWEKGIHTVIEALALRPGLDVELVILGWMSEGDPEGLAIRDLAARDARVHFVGPVEPGALPAILATADLAVIPSIWFETGPLTVFEAQAAGLPIIGSDRGGVAELCAGNPAARSFPAGDAAALAALLAELAAAPDLVSEMRRHVPQRPRSMDDVAEETLRIYQQLVEGQDARSARDHGIQVRSA